MPNPVLPDDNALGLARTGWCSECHQPIYQHLDAQREPVGLWHHMENSSTRCPYVVQP